MSKRRVLIVYRSYFPARTHLGPATAIRNLVNNLSDDYTFHILTLNYDFATKQQLFPDRYHTVIDNNVTIEYVPRGWRSLTVLAKRLSGKFDAIDIHCAFDPLLAIPALVLSKLGIAGRARVFHTPHGVFMDTIMATRARRKRLFCRATDFSGLYRRITHLAGSATEKLDIERRHQTPQQVEVTSQFIEPAPSGPTRRRKPKDSLKIALVGRVAPQKNVTFAIGLVRQLNVPAMLDIYGDTDDRSYFAECLTITPSLFDKSAVRFLGNIEKRELLQRLSDYDVLLHPTLGENFGHAIVESLALGLPVLASDRSPWNDLAAHQAGWSLPLSDPQAFVAKLESIYAMDDEWSLLSDGAANYARSKFDRAETVSRYRAAYG